MTRCDSVYITSSSCIYRYYEPPRSLWNPHEYKQKSCSSTRSSVSMALLLWPASPSIFDLRLSTPWTRRREWRGAALTDHADEDPGFFNRGIKKTLPFLHHISFLRLHSCLPSLLQLSSTMPGWLSGTLDSPDGHFSKGDGLVALPPPPSPPPSERWPK